VVLVVVCKVKLCKDICLFMMCGICEQYSSLWSSQQIMMERCLIILNCFLYVLFFAACCTCKMKAKIVAFSSVVLLLMFCLWASLVLNAANNFAITDVLDKVTVISNVNKSSFYDKNDAIVHSFVHQSQDGSFPNNNGIKLRIERIDPEENMNAQQLITSKGLPCEEHFPITQDGYILGMQRIPQPTPNKLPVLLMHGLLSSSDCFLTNLINESLAYILHKEGYDVWLGNVRGNRYSKNHVTLSPDDYKFWRWSFDEMGKYDIPAMVDYILQKTNHSSLNYIGHSQGCTCLLTAAMSRGNEFSNKISSFIALAPAGFVTHATSPLRYITYVANDIKLVYWLFGDGDFLPHAGLIEMIAKMACPHDEKYCENLYFLIGGTDFSNTNISRVPVYAAHNPAGTSTQNMVHWAQMIATKENVLKYYDYEHWYLNLQHYGQLHPPSYNFDDFDIPSYIFCGGKDTLVVPTDCKTLVNTVNSVKNFTMVSTYTHLDFLYAINSPYILYNNIIDILQSV